MRSAQNDLGLALGILVCSGVDPTGAAEAPGVDVVFLANEGVYLEGGGRAAFERVRF